MGGSRGGSMGMGVGVVAWVWGWVYEVEDMGGVKERSVKRVNEG